MVIPCHTIESVESCDENSLVTLSHQSQLRIEIPKVEVLLIS